ncbi:MAG: efflux RND transporter periplasmic adaptor subunit [Pirellulales bacterium]
MRSLPILATRLALAGGAVVVLIAVSWGLWSLTGVPERLGLRSEPAKDEGAHSHGDGHDHGEAEHEGHDHDAKGHDHSHAGHDEDNSLELSKQAQATIGLKIVPVKVGPFARTISVPGIVVERPGRSSIKVTAPLTGIVTRIYAIQGESLYPGSKLFELRLTHEELVQAQSDLLRYLGEHDVTRREVDRLERLTASGAVAGKERLDRQYEMHRLEATIQAQRQALALHGLTGEQVESIITTRSLFQTMSVVVPQPPEDVAGSDRTLQVQRLAVQQGQQVQAGEELCSLADYSELQIEGMAFERDADSLQRAAIDKAPIAAYFDTGEHRSPVSGLQLLYVSGQVDPDSRALHFYVRLPNERLPDVQTGEHQFTNWRFRPGQRLRMSVPVETWPDRIVLPVQAVVQEGPESFVFVQFGDHFDRRSVQVAYRDADHAVLDPTGGLKPGEMVAADGAQQLQLALKNKAGGAVDPHAGHNH